MSAFSRCRPASWPRRPRHGIKPRPPSQMAVPHHEDRRRGALLAARRAGSRWTRCRRWRQRPQWRPNQPIRSDRWRSAWRLGWWRVRAIADQQTTGRRGDGGRRSLRRATASSEAAHVLHPPRGSGSRKPLRSRILLLGRERRAIIRGSSRAVRSCTELRGALLKVLEPELAVEVRVSPCRSVPRRSERQVGVERRWKIVPLYAATPRCYRGVDRARLSRRRAPENTMVARNLSALLTKAMALLQRGDRAAPGAPDRRSRPPWPPRSAF